MEINNNNYELIKNEKDAFSDDILEKITDYYNGFDYIVGDFAYGKVRLKGFCELDNKNYKSYNDYRKVDQYLEDKCAFGCKFFILKKLAKKK